MTSQIYIKIYNKISNFACVMSQRTNVNCVYAVASVLFQILKDISQELITGW